ncbi:histone-like nucleoid-structuring protein Lsr2 [Corynebacterium sp. H130]|uniref:histone-like nucleoid-structuring protein Lsr2 n=1 Tax=Corynebacterium sp. H130 TaxID=3133444 RepID=UPI0030B305BB
MARREVIQFFDDLDNSPLTATEVNVIKFSVNGTNYIIDLSAQNAAKFEKAIQPFVEAARKDNTPAKKAANTPDPKLIREWAQSQGIEVAARGKLSNEIIEKYLAAH